MTIWLQLLRVRQWTKNLIVFAGLVFSQQLMVASQWALCFWAFFSFCFMSSAIYILNDMCDRHADRLNPEKAQRPLASGAISLRAAATMSGLLFMGSISVAIVALPQHFLVLVAAYALLMTAYSLLLKRMVVVDVFVIAMGFILRAQAGVEAIQVPLSFWFLLCTLFLSLFLGFCKRRYELVSCANAGEHRQTLQKYHVSSLDIYITISAALTVMTYALYTMSPQTVEKFSYKHLEWTVPFVILGLFRYIHLVYKEDQGGHPDKILLTDIPLIACIVVWMICVVAVVY